MTKEEKINLIAGRIADEYRRSPTLDWAKIAATKIINEWDESNLYDFFLWFRENGELHMDKSIESMIKVYLNK